MTTNSVTRTLAWLLTVLVIVVLATPSEAQRRKNRNSLVKFSYSGEIGLLSEYFDQGVQFGEDERAIQAKFKAQAILSKEWQVNGSIQATTIRDSVQWKATQSITFVPAPRVIARVGLEEYLYRRPLRTISADDYTLTPANAGVDLDNVLVLERLDSLQYTQIYFEVGMTFRGAEYKYRQIRLRSSDRTGSDFAQLHDIYRPPGSSRRRGNLWHELKIRIAGPSFRLGWEDDSDLGVFEASYTQNLGENIKLHVSNLRWLDREIGSSSPGNYSRAEGTDDEQVFSLVYTF